MSDCIGSVDTVDTSNNKDGDHVAVLNDSSWTANDDSVAVLNDSSWTANDDSNDASNLIVDEGE